MLYFILGIILGFIIVNVIVATLIFFRHPISRKVEKIMNTPIFIANKPKGFIIEPESDADEARNDIIEKNKKAGRDTKVSDLL